MRISIRTTLTAVTLAALTAMTAAGCSSAAKSPAAGATAGGTAQGAATSAAAGSGSGSGTGSSQGGSSSELDVCKLLPLAQASSAGGETYASAVATTIAPGQDQCVYEGPASSYARMTVIVYQSDSGVTFQTVDAVQTGIGTVTNVSGVGDKAIAGAIELDVEAGSHVISVEGADGMATGDDSASIAVAKAVIAALG
jgi:hypothetical protein